MPKEKQSFKNLSGPEKAAIFLLTMGEDFTTAVFRALGDFEIKNMGRAMSLIHKLTPVDVQDVLRECVGMFEEASEARIKGDDVFKNTLNLAIHAERADSLLRDVTSPAPFSQIKNIDPKILGNYIINEHPQTAALILAYLDPGKSARILSSFPKTLQQEVVLRIAELKTVPITILDEVEDILRAELKAQASVFGRLAGGSDTVVEILNQVDQNTVTVVLARLKEARPELFYEVFKLMFVFEDLIGVDDRYIRVILKEINIDELTMALKAASEGLKEKIYANLSERAADMIRESLKAMGPARLSDVEKAQQAILRVTRQLEAESKIPLVKNDESGQLG